MLDVCLVGTGGMMPLPRRWLTALMTRYNGSSLLIDCGEGTQVAIKEKGWSFKPIDVICFTHYHGDHISGLPGLLLTMGNADRTEPLTLVGPKGLERVVNALRVIAPELPFEIKFIEITQPEQVIELNGYRITAFKVNHNVLCYGYTLEILRQGKFSAERAKEQDIPLKYWNPLQKGQTIEADGITYTPEMVLGPARKGIRLTYTTDTRPTESILRNAKESDLFICEGMYGEDDKADKARGYKHMTFREAAVLARDARVKEMWLTHYSPSLVRPDEFMDKVREIFPNAYPGKDGKSLEKDIIALFEDNKFIKSESEKNRKDIRNILKKLEFCYQKAGLVKYDAFNEMGGKLSFSLAMLNESDNGFVLNAVHSREGCYTYIKEIIDGNSIITLAEEEQEALKMAKESTGSNVGTGGMATKLAAAKIATLSGTDMIIANGGDVRILQDIFENDYVGTLFTANENANFNLANYIMETIG